MKTFYVLGSVDRYAVDEEWFGTLDEAMHFESLCQALDFNESSGLQLEVLRVEITSVYTPNLLNSIE